MADRFTKILLFFCLFIACGAFFFHTIIDVDIFWHLKAGQYILENRAIPSKDIFSYTAFGKEWVDLHWLFQVLTYSVYTTMGEKGLNLLEALLLSLACFFLFRTAYDKEHSLLSVLWFALVLLAANQRFILRPGLITLLMVALYGWALFGYKYRGRETGLYFIPLLQGLWVNAQGLFIIGLVILFAYLIGEAVSQRLPLSKDETGFTLRGRRYQKLAMMSLLALLACFLNPYTYKGFAFPFTLLSQIGERANIYAQTIAEFQPPFSSYNPTRGLFFYKAFLLMCLITLGVNWRKLTPTMLLLFSSFCGLSLLARRNVDLFAFVSMPIMVHLWRGKLKDSGLWRAPPGVLRKYIPAWLLSGLFLWLSWQVVTNHYYLADRRAERFGLGFSRAVNPYGAMEFLKAHPIEGNIFNNIDIGGFFIWHLYPQKKAFIDTRLEVHSRAFMRYYLGAILREDLWADLVRRYDIKGAVLSHTSPETSPLIKRLFDDEGWKLVYFDEVGVVFIRDLWETRHIKAASPEKFSSPNIRTTQELPLHQEGSFWQRLKRKVQGPPYPPSSFQRGNLFAILGLYELAIEDYKTGLKVFPNSAEGYYNLALAYKGMGDEEEAQKNYHKALALEPKLGATAFRGALPP